MDKLTNRENKFRAWDIEEKNMYYPFCRQKMSDCDSWLIDSIGAVNESLRKEDIIWMQYTGLKDKNKKEIYEGDIVTYTCLNYFGIDGKLDRDKCNEYSITGRVVYIKHLCRFMLAKIGYEEFDGHEERKLIKSWQFDGWNNTMGIKASDERNESIIIGNIYDNPELLKEIKD